MSRSVSRSFLINSRPLLVSQSRISHQLSTFACQSVAHFSSTLNLCLSVSSSFVSNSRPLLVSQSSFLINSRPLLYHAWKRKKEKLTNVLASSSAQLLWFTAGAETSPHHAVRKTGSPRKKSLSPPSICTRSLLLLLPAGLALYTRGLYVSTEGMTLGPNEFITQVDPVQVSRCLTRIPVLFSSNFKQ